MFKKNKNNKPKKTRKPKKAENVEYKLSGGAGGSRKNLLFQIGFAVAGLVITFLLYSALSSMFSTETYYVLNQNIKSKQMITPDMVTDRVTSKGTGPINALSMESIQRGEVFSRYPLYAGDVIAKSNAGPISVDSLGIPDSWLVTSFSIVSTDAVGGTLGRGDYVDLIGIGDQGAQYVFNNLLVLEVKFVNQELDGKIDGETVVGEAMHYTVGLPAEHVAHLHSALNDYDSIKLVKSPLEINYADRDTSKLDKTFKYGPDVGNIDLIEGTDPTFTELERDENGKPINVYEGEDIIEEDNDIVDEEPTDNNSDSDTTDSNNEGEANNNEDN